ncbi:MAG: SGNH/GDSL hydrolase family protein [Fimbriimonas sp.]
MIAVVALAMLSGTPLDAGIQRTMHLLATSTATRRNTVRILFYGQSITGNQPWPGMVIDDLKRRYPHADIQWENRAIGGFAANFLKRTALYDVVPYSPDLVILHDYGGEPDYEELIRNIVQNTAAEVAVMDDFETTVLKGGEPGDVVRRQSWHDAHSVWLRKLCERYGLGFISTREPWKAHVRRTGETAKDLTTDGTHPNEKGNDLMAAIVSPQLRYDPKVTEVRWKDRVSDHAATQHGGELTLNFRGDRVDLFPNFLEPAGGHARVLIDGKPPSAFNGCYAFSRPSPAYQSWMPMITRLGSNALRRVEDWTLTVTGVEADGITLRFRLEGSKTGPDGEGRTDEDFVSTSGRVTIGKDDWAVKYARDVSRQTTPVGFECRWKVIPMFRDVYVRPVVQDRAVERGVTLVQGLPPGPHWLQVVSEDKRWMPIKFVRTYRPRRGDSPLVNESR